MVTQLNAGSMCLKSGNQVEITLSEEILTGTKHNKSIPFPFCNKGWLLLLTLKAIQFPNHERSRNPRPLGRGGCQIILWSMKKENALDEEETVFF